MKKVLPLILALVFMLGLIACNRSSVDVKDNIENDNDACLVLNAVVSSIDMESQILFIRDVDDNHYFDKKRAVDCKELIENNGFIYVDYDTRELVYIDLSDLEVGDHIIITVFESELHISEKGYIEATQIQLST